MLVSSLGMAKVDVGWRLRIVALRLDEARLEMDDVLPQRIILRLDRFKIVLQIVQLSDLLLKLLDISFLSLSERTL